MKATNKAKKMANYWVALGALYPLLTALLIFSGLTFIVYRGQSQDRYRNIINGHLLKTSLKLSQNHLSPPIYPELNKFLVVDSSPLDFHHLFAQASMTSQIGTYAQIISHLQKSPNAQDLFIVLNWDLPHSTLNQFNQKLLATLPPGFLKQVYIVVNNTDKISEQFYFQLLSNDSCEDRHLPQTFCSFNLDWHDWAVQTMYDLARFSKSPQESEQPLPKSALTSTLPNALPGFIIAPPGLKNFQHSSIQELLAKPLSSDIRGVFIGQNHLDHQNGQLSAPNSDQSYIKVFAPPSPIQSETVPYHHFLAMLFGQHLLKHYVLVPPTPWLVLGVAIICIMAIIAVFFSRKPVLLFFLISMVVLLPFLNALLIRFSGVYLPGFELYYFLLFSFLFASFLKLSWISFGRLRLKSEERALAHATDIKANFISLLSHNLNTPVAKMNGLLQILVQQSITPALKEELILALRYVTELEVTIKSVLITTALEERSTNDALLRLDQFVQEVENLQAVMKRLGIKMMIDVKEGENDLLPFKLDKRVVGHAITAAMTLFGRKASEGRLKRICAATCQIEITEDDVSPNAVTSTDPTGQELERHLVITIISDQTWLTPHTIECLATRRGPPLRDITSEQFMDGVFANLISSVARHYLGTLQLTPFGQGGKIRLNIPIS